MSFSFGAPEEVVDNRKRFLSKLGIGFENCIRLDDFHGTDIISVDKSFKGQGVNGPNGGPKADAAITAEKNLFLFLPTGDCLPIIFYDFSKRILALAHLSRINTPQMFVQKIIEQFEKAGSNSKDIFVGIGPGVRKESYLFDGDELTKRIIGHNEWKNFLIDSKNGKTGIDLVGYNIHQLVSAGINRENIEIADVDTIVDKNFFSHYRSRKTGEPEGRMATVVGIKN